MVDYSKEHHDALLDQELPPINPRYYGEHADVIGRMGVQWLEDRVAEWESDHPEKVKP